MSVICKSFPNYWDKKTQAWKIKIAYLFDGECVWHHLYIALGLRSGQTLQGDRTMQGRTLWGVHLSSSNTSRASNCTLAFEEHFSLNNNFGNFWFAEATNPEGSLQKLLWRNLERGNLLYNFFRSLPGTA